MSSNIEQLFAAVTGPCVNRVVVRDVSTTGSIIDLEAIAGFGDLLKDGHAVNIVCDQDFHYVWTNGSTSVVDPDATTGAGQCWSMKADVERPDFAPKGNYKLDVVAADDGKIRIAISSELRS